MNTDSVQTIKDYEARAQGQIEALSQENHKKFEEETINAEKNLEEYKEALRKEGQASLQNAKQEAMTSFKKITDSEDTNRSSIISQATSKKDEAVKKIVLSFEKYLAL